ncbi:MAG: tol-pal system protein YbgF [Thermodesulfobacteriota bacterium]
MMALKHLAIALLFIPLFTGCGPGMPIMTVEQKQMMADITSLKGDSADYKRRLTTLEQELSGSDGAEAGGLAFEIRKTRAELDSDIDRVREEMASLRGGIESAAHTSALLRESIGDVEIKIEEVAARQGKSPATEQRVTTDIEARLSSLTARVDDLEKRILPIEKGALSAKARASTTSTEKPVALYNRALLLLKDKKYERSLASFTRFIELFPSHELTDNAQYWIGELFYDQGDWERAVLEFDTVIKKYPDGDKAPAALLKEGLSFNRIGATKEARLLLQRVIDNYPKSSEARLARERLKKMGKGKR